MGCGASVARPSANSKKPSTPASQRAKVDKEASEVPNLMASLQGHMSNNQHHEDEDTKMIHSIDIDNGSFSKKSLERIECDDIVEFKINGKDEYDIIQVYKDGNDYYRVINGYELLNIKSRTPEKDRRILLSLGLNQPELELHFCIIPSSDRQTVSTTRKCPKANCEQNCLTIHQSEIKFSLNDEKKNQKVWLHKGDTVEIEWKTKHAYRIEEKKYCPVSGGLYTVEQKSDKVSNRFSTNGKFSKTFDDFGMSFLYRVTDKNEIHDIIVCVVNETYKMKHIEITENNIIPNIIWIEQTDWIVFEWNTKRKQTIVQIEPFTIDANNQQSIELKTPGKHCFWPYESTRRGYMHHQFNEIGIYCYKTGINQIGTIIVEPHKAIYHIPIFGDQFVYRMNTNDLVQFDWKMTDSKSNSVLITIDPLSSVVPHTFGGVTGVFDCATHKCNKVDEVFRHHFNTCETFLLNIPQHGLYNFAFSDNPDTALTSVIVENGVDNHRVEYNEHNAFEPHTLIINRFDQLWFDSSSSKVAAIYHTDEFGNGLESDQPIFQPQQNSINYFMKEFNQLGIYYFSTEKDDIDKEKDEKTSTHPLAIIVLPEVRFHYKAIRKNDFDSQSIITNVNDFIIWHVEENISHNVLHIRPDETLKDLISCHDRAVAGRNRRCLAVECIQSGTFFFANPEFERVTGLQEERLIATIIVEPPFSQNCFVISNRQFAPQILHIAENDTVSWALAKNERNHRISVQSIENERDIDEDELINRNITDFLHDVHHLHTFHKAGKYIIRSDRLQSTATVVVYPENIIRSQKKRVQEPQLIDEINVLSRIGAPIHLDCPSRNANIYYTLDGSSPTRRYDHVQEYDPNNGIVLLEQGLRVVRAYATEDQKLSSIVLTSSPTFVLGNQEIEPLNGHQGVWNDCKITLAVLLEQPNKLYGNIEIQPTSSKDSIDHFELYINNIPQKTHIALTDVQFSADGFAGGERYEIYVIAYPKRGVDNAEPIPSNKRAFEIKREVPGGGPLVSLAVSNDQNALFLMWAHIGDHVSEYIVYVDNTATKTLTKDDFNDFYGIQFHGAEQRKEYSLHVDAKIKNSNDIRKSNVISVTTPLETPINGPIIDQYFPYITIKSEPTPSDKHLEKSSDRLTSPKLSAQNSSSLLSSSPPPPAASSRPGVHLTNTTNTTLSTSKSIRQKSDDETSNLNEQQQQSSTKPQPITRKNKTNPQNTKSILSDDSRYRAQILLEKLTQAIENRSTHLHSHTSFSSNHDQLLSQRSSHDPYTNKLPPKSQRRSFILNKTFNQNDTIQPENLPQRRPEGNRKAETLPITNDLQNSAPTISYEENPNGITLFWNKGSQPSADSVENYRIIVDQNPYGECVAPQAEPKFQLNLPPGKHEIILETIPKDKNEKILKSNVLSINITITDGLKSEQKQQPESPTDRLQPERKQQSEPSDAPVYKILEQKDLPIPKLTVQTINSSSIRTNWYLDRPIPSEAHIAKYEVHVRGQNFPDRMTSDENSRQDGYIEHVWRLHNSPLEIIGISERHEYLVFVRALFNVQGLSDTKYITTTSNEVKTVKINPLIDLVTRPALKVDRVGLQMASLSWKLDDSVDQSLVKGYRIVLNSKPTEILPSNQHEYELRNIKPGTTNEVQVSVTTHPDFVDEKTSEPVRIVCPQRPQPPTVQAIKAEKPYSIRIKWKIDNLDQDEITSFKIFLDGKLHGEIDVNGRQSFKYDFNKLQPNQTYSIYVKSLLGQKRHNGNIYQCDVESNASKELVLKCAVPPKGTTPRIERMHSNGVDIVWDAPVEHGDVKLTGYQILKNGRSIGKSLPVDKRRASVNDLEAGNRYSLQVVPITDQPGGTLFRTGEEYDADRHGHYLPGEKLEVEYTDLVQVPRKFWIENIAGRSALVCWTPVDQSASSNIQPDSYKLFISNDKDLPRDKAMIIPLTIDKSSVQLKDLQPDTTYEIQLEVYKKRRHATTNDPYVVTATAEKLTFVTGAPPDPPLNVHLIASTNTDVRIGFDPFIEHDAEIKALRVQYEPISSQAKAKEISMDITPDSTEFILSNLTENTEYNVTIYAVTEEYLNENRYRDVSQLPKKLKPSEWLPNTSLHFQTSGCEPSSQLNIRQATFESIQLEWTLAKVYGSTQFISQILRWQLEHGGEEHSMELDQNTKNAKIPGPLPSGSYKISLDSVFNVKINLEDDDDETSRKEIRLTTNTSTSVRFHAPPSCEQPQIFLTGYTTRTIDLTWNKPNMFDMIEHPEKNNEQLKIHRRLVGYRIDINGRKHNTLDEDSCRCTLTDCQPDTEYKIQLVAQTTIQNEYMDNMITDGKENAQESDETPSKNFPVRMLKDRDLLRSFQANFEFNHNGSNGNTTKQQNEVKSLGKINVDWKVSDTKTISHFILQWRSSKDLRIQHKTVASNETSSTIDSCDEKHYYVIEIIIVTNDSTRHPYEQLTIPIPGVPDAPKLWLVKRSDTSFTVEWSEPKSYGISVIGFQLFIEGKKAGGMIEINSRRAEIPSRINQTYQVNVCAITNNPQRPHSLMSEKLPVITTPVTNLTPLIYYNNDDGSPTSFDRSIARIIPLRIETINEEKLHIDWTSFLHTPTIRAYYVHYTCLSSGEVQTMKVSKRFRHTVIRGLRPGFTYGIMVMAVDKNGGILYISDKRTVQMNAPPNAPIVAISERTTDHVKLEWRPVASYGEITITGYKIFVNNRLAAILSHDQLTYTLTNGTPCDIYTVDVQALSSEDNIVSPMLRGVQFTWPGIKPGAFRRINDGQTGNVIVAWEHPQLEDEMEKLIGYKLYSENTVTHAVRLHGDYDAGTYQATIDGLNSGKYLIWLEVQGENNRTRSRPITVVTGRFNSLSNRQTSSDSMKCYTKQQNRFRSPGPKSMTPPLRHLQYS